MKNLNNIKKEFIKFLYRNNLNELPDLNDLPDKLKSESLDIELSILKQEFPNISPEVSEENYSTYISNQIPYTYIWCSCPLFKVVLK